MVNSIENNTIGEAHTKQKLNALNEIKKAEIKNKRLITSQKILLQLFDELIEAIFNNKSVSKTDDNVSMNESENESESVNENENESDNENENVSKNENESVDKIDDNVDTNNYFNIIDKTKSFEDQIEILKKWMI